MLEFCSVQDQDGVWLVTIERPERLNALHPDANFELATVFDAFLEDTDARVAIITGSGDRAFCVGHDLHHLNTGTTHRVPETGFAGLTHCFRRTKPVIAAVNGLALGAGFEIALACDLVIAADDAEFALPEPRYGLAASMGGLHRLPRQIGLKEAMGLILTGRRIDAREAQRLGLVNELVPRADVVPAALRWARQILECSPGAIAASMEIVWRGLEEASTELAVTADYTATRVLQQNPDATEGPRAFVERRRPVWSGRSGG